MGSLFESLRALITVIDELRDIGLQQYISLPRIVAIGTQSSGKSSVIESVCGLDFLPRGDGVVTRRPLELRLVHLNVNEYPEDTAWAVFEKNQKKITNFDEVRAEIERQTDEIAGKNKGILDDPILLTVYATSSADLTLIDLPGITRVPVKGSDQTEDIEKTTREMTLRYISDPRTVILAVLPANQDMAVSDALQLARQVDPKGVRTIGVITKIDIMDHGTDAVRMLKGEDISLKLGYVGVKLRSKQDITDGKRVKRALVDEKEWFESHRIYSKLPPGLTGCSTLVGKLTKILFKVIRQYLPEIKKEINEKRRSVQDRLDELGEGVPLEAWERNELMFAMISDFVELFKNCVRGKFDRKLQRHLSSNSDRESFFGGSQIRHFFNEFLLDYLEESITASLSDDQIDVAIRMHEGDSLPGFPSGDTFEYLIVPHIRKIEMPTLECLHSVASALDLLAQKIARVVFSRFPLLADEVLEITSAVCQREKEHTRVLVEQIVAFHTNYLFTNDSRYLSQHGSMEAMYGSQEKPPPAKEEPPPPPEPSRIERALSSAGAVVKDGTRAVKSVFAGAHTHTKRREIRYSGPYIQEVRKRLDSYFALVISNVREAVPKAIGYFLVRALTEKLQFALHQQLGQPEQILALLGEPLHIMEERRALAAQLATLSKAITVLNRDPKLSLILHDDDDDDSLMPMRSTNRQVRQSTPSQKSMLKAPSTTTTQTATTNQPTNPASVAVSQVRPSTTTTQTATTNQPTNPPSVAVSQVKRHTTHLFPTNTTKPNNTAALFGFDSDDEVLAVKPKGPLDK